MDNWWSDIVRTELFNFNFTLFTIKIKLDLSLPALLLCSLELVEISKCDVVNKLIGKFKYEYMLRKS